MRVSFALARLSLFVLLLFLGLPLAGCRGGPASGGVGRSREEVQPWLLIKLKNLRKDTTATARSYTQSCTERCVPAHEPLGPVEYNKEAACTCTNGPQTLGARINVSFSSGPGLAGSGGPYPGLIKEVHITAEQVGTQSKAKVYFYGNVDPVEFNLN